MRDGGVVNRHLARRAVLSAITLGVAARSAAAEEARDRRQAEALKSSAFQDAAGVTRRLRDLTRPLLMINLWAYWCSGCLTEIPSMLGMARAIGAENIEVVLLSHAMNWTGDVRYARTAGFPFPLWRLVPLTPDSTIADTFRMQDNRFGLPQTLVFAGSGLRLVHASEGAEDWSSAARISRARAWLAGAA